MHIERLAQLHQLHILKISGIQGLCCGLVLERCYGLAAKILRLPGGEKSGKREDRQKQTSPCEQSISHQTA
jgi:hypothetical protein